MKIDIGALEQYAKDESLRNDYELSQELGIKQYLIRAARDGKKIGYDAVKDFYNRNGERLTRKLIDFEEDTLNGFKAKYVQVGNELY